MFNLLKKDKAFYKIVFTLALPIAGQSLLSFSLSVMDTFFLGFIGGTEITAATFANAPYFILTMILFGAQSGASILISQYYGKGDTKKISEIIGINFFSTFVIALGFAIVTTIFPYEIMSFFTPDESTRQLAVSYMKIVAFSFPINVFTQVILGAHRSMGNPTPGLQISMVATVLNVLLNSIFIFGLFGFPRMEVAGAALGTLISRIVELIITIVFTFKNKFYKIDAQFFLKPSKEITGDYLRYAGPVIINETLWGSAMSLYPAIYGRLGDVGIEIVAAYSIGVNVERIFGVVSKSIGDAACVMVGSQIGQNKYDTAKDYAKTLILLATMLAIILAGALYISAPAIASIFEITQNEKDTLVIFLTVLSVRMPLWGAFYCMLIGVVRAGGDSKFGMLVDVLSIWIFGVGIAFVVTSFTVNPWFVYVSKIIDELVKTILLGWRIKSGKWINNITVDKPRSYIKK